MMNRPPPMLLLVLLAAILYGGEYLRRDLWEPDEARYAYIAREMAVDGHLVVPYRNGEPYAHKPPLMFWLIRAGSAVLGGEVSPLAARLPSFLGVLLTLAAVRRIAVQFFSPAAAWYSVLVLMTSVLFWQKGGMGQIDALLCGLQVTAVALLLGRAERVGRGQTLLAYVLMGLAVLAKGPVGFVVPYGIFLGASWALKDQRASLLGKHLAWGPLVTIAFPLAWLGLAWLEGAPASYFQELLVDQNAGRAAGTMGHRQPFYYFLGYLPLDFFPWTFLLPAAWAVNFRERRWTPTLRMLAAWFLFVLCFFSILSGKRNLYILTCYVALALFTGAAWSGLGSAGGRLTAWCRYGPGGGYLLLGVALGAALVFKPLKVPLSAMFLGALLFISGGLLLLVLAKGRSRLFGMQLAAVTLALFAYTGTFLLPLANPVKTPAAMVAFLRERGEMPKTLGLYRINGEILALYAGSHGRTLETPEEAADLLRSDPGSAVVFRDRHADVIDQLGLEGLQQFEFDLGSKHFLLICTAAH